NINTHYQCKSLGLVLKDGDERIKIKILCAARLIRRSELSDVNLISFIRSSADFYDILIWLHRISNRDFPHGESRWVKIKNKFDSNGSCHCCLHLQQATLLLTASKY